MTIVTAKDLVNDINNLINIYGDLEVVVESPELITTPKRVYYEGKQIIIECE